MTKNKSLGVFAIIVVVVLGVLIFYNYTTTYTTRLAYLKAQHEQEQQTLSEIKELEATLPEPTDVNIQMRLYHYTDALIVEVVQGEDQYLPTQFVFDRGTKGGLGDYGGDLYTICARFYHVFAKTGDSLDYYGYIIRGKWYGRDSWFSSRKWHYVNYFIKSSDAYFDSFEYIFTGKVTSGDPAYDLMKARLNYAGHINWNAFHADYVSKLNWNGTVGLELFYKQLLQKDFFWDRPQFVVNFEEDYFSSNMGWSKGAVINPFVNLGITNTDYRGHNFFDYTTADRMIEDF